LNYMNTFAIALAIQFSKSLNLLTLSQLSRISVYTDNQ